MFKLILLFIFFLSCLACESGQYEALLKMHYTDFPSEQSFIIYKGLDNTGLKVFELHGTSADTNQDVSNTICVESTTYTIYFYDTDGDGWGSVYSASYLIVSVGGVELLRFGLPRSQGSLSAFDTKTFMPSFLITLNSNWKYTDAPQSTNEWTLTSYTDNTWNSGIAGSFPDLTQMTRYYRYSVAAEDYTNISSYLISLLTAHGVVIYINGQEIYRYKILSGPITSSTSSTSPADTLPIIKLITFNKFILPSNGMYIIGIEVHKYVTDTNLGDKFNFAYSIASQNPGTCSSTRFFDGSILAQPENTISSYTSAELFDNNLNTYYYSRQGDVAEIIYKFNNGNSFWLNSYALGAATKVGYGYPSSIKLYGSKDQLTWELLDVKEQINIPNQDVLRVFSFYNNPSSYRGYKLQVLSSTVAGNLAFSEFQGYLCNIPSFPSTLQYASNSYSFVATIDTVDISPITGGYTGFTTSPSLPSGLTISSSGAIRGIIMSGESKTYSISATNVKTGQTESVNIAINIDACIPPLRAQIRLTKTNGYWSSEEGFTVMDQNSNVLLSSPAFSTTDDYVATLCVPSGKIIIYMYDNGNDGWSYSSSLVVDLFDYYNSYYNVDTVKVLSGHNTTYILNASYIVPMKSSLWTYRQGFSTSSNWYTSTVPSDFSPFPISSLPQTTSTMWLFRHVFTVTSVQGYVGYELHLKTTAGYIIYLNGVELYRKFLADGPITSSTTAIGGDLHTAFRTVSGSNTFLHIGTDNLIAIALINLPGNNPTTVDFDCSLQFLQSASIGRVRSATISDSPVGKYVNYLLLEYDSYAWTNTVPKGTPVSVLINYGLSRAEFVSKYCFKTASTLTDYNPSDWAIYGSNDGSIMTLLGNVTNAYFSGPSQERCFYLPNNNKPWQYYKLLITEPANAVMNPATLSLSKIYFYLDDMKQIVIPPLSVSQTEIVGYINVAFPEIAPNSQYYTNFSISPSLVLPLELDTSTGSIRGIPLSASPRSLYTLTGTDPNGQQSSVQIYITITTCAENKVMFTVLIHSGVKGEEMGFQLVNKNNVVIKTQLGFVSEQDNYYPFCESVGYYTLTLNDSGRDGWDSGYFNVYLQDNSVILKGSLGRNEATKSFPLSIGYLISPLVTEWTYLNSNSAPISTWASLSFSAEGWSKNLPMNFGSASGITQYMRRTFIIDSVTNYASLIFNIKTRYGVFVYINGNLVFSDNVNSEDYSSYCIIEKSSSEYVGSAIPITSSNLVQGTNVIAVSIHRSQSTQYTNIDFDCNVLLTGDNSYRVLNGSPSSDMENDIEVSKVFDNIKGTVYISGPRCVGASPTWTYSNNRKEYITSYNVITGPNCNTRHPSSWIFEGSNTSGKNWSVLNIVHDAIFTEYSQSVTYSFYNDKAFNSYRLRATECNNQALHLDSTSEGNCVLVGSQTGFQLSEIGLYSKTVTISCPPSDGFGGAIEGEYAYKDCPQYYIGRIEALCTSGTLRPSKSYCDISAPTLFTYNSVILNVITNTDVNIKPNVDAIELQFTIVPSLPECLSLNPSTGVITGKIKSQMDSQLYVITCKNTAGQLSTSIYISATTTTTIPVWIYIVFGVIIVAVIIIIVVCVLKRQKSRKNKVHITKATKTTKTTTDKEKTKSAIKV